MRVVSLLLAALGLMAQNVTIRQDGPDWVRTDTGSRIVNPRGELKVRFAGPDRSAWCGRRGSNHLHVEAAGPRGIGSRGEAGVEQWRPSRSIRRSSFPGDFRRMCLPNWF